MLNWLWRALEKGTCGVRCRPQPSLHNTRLTFQTKSDIGKTSSRSVCFDMFWLWLSFLCQNITARCALNIALLDIEIRDVYCRLTPLGTRAGPGRCIGPSRCQMAFATGWGVGKSLGIREAATQCDAMRRNIQCSQCVHWVGPGKCCAGGCWWGRYWPQLMASSHFQ